MVYQIQSNKSVMSDASWGGGYDVSCFHDAADNRADGGQSSDDQPSEGAEWLIMEARLRSGDYLVTLATECEQVADMLRDEGRPEADFLANIAEELMYAHTHYVLKQRS